MFSFNLDSVWRNLPYDFEWSVHLNGKISWSVRVFFSYRIERPRAEVKLIMKKLIEVNSRRDDRLFTFLSRSFAPLKHVCVWTMCLSQYLYNQIDLTNWIQIINSTWWILPLKRKPFTFSQYEHMKYRKMRHIHAHAHSVKWHHFLNFQFATFIKHLRMGVLLTLFV